MKLICLTILCLFVSQINFCQSEKIKKQDEENVLIAQQINRKYNIKATFYGTILRFGDNGEDEAKIIRQIVFQDEKTGNEVRYIPPENSSQQAADFYFTNIWSPDEEHAVLPIGKFEGFAIFESKDILANVKGNKYFDTIKVKLEGSGWFWHDFDNWEDDSIFAFRAGLDGDMFAYKYNLANKELYCYQEKCENSDVGVNAEGKAKVIKKGIIEPTKIH